MNFEYARGNIFWCNLPQHQVQNHSVEKGYRPVVIISSLMGALNSDILMVCPLTTKIKELSVNVKISWSKDDRQSQVLCNQIMTVPKIALGKQIGNLTDTEIDDVNTAMLISLGIAPSVTNNIQKALISAKKDVELLQQLLPQAKQIITQLTEVVKRTEVTKRKKRTPEEMADFIKEWNDKGNDRNEVAEAFGYKSYGAAYAAANKRASS